ncbi:MAG: DUF302 domain-containing protein [Gemmatimonadaceae bacterium]
MLDADKTSLVEIASRAAFKPTLERLIQGIEAAGMAIFAQIDHAAGARAIGVLMPPATVLIYGHARGGTPIMLAAPKAALDLPLRVLVRESEDSRTLVSFHPIGAALRQMGVTDMLTIRLESAQQLLEQLIP